jgi:hypothetical protein
MACHFVACHLPIPNIVTSQARRPSAVSPLLASQSNSKRQPAIPPDGPRDRFLSRGASEASGCPRDALDCLDYQEVLGDMAIDLGRQGMKDGSIVKAFL